MSAEFRAEHNHGETIGAWGVGRGMAWSIVSAAILVFSLSACGSGETASKRVEAATTAGSESAQPAVAVAAEQGFYSDSSAVSDAHHEACPHIESGTRGACCPDEGSVTPKNARPPEFTWQKPPEWTEVTGNPMRLVSFTLGQADQIECYVTVLPGAAGGVLANMNRWRNQMGLAALTPLEVAELTYIDMLNEKAPLLELRGEFKDADGGRTGTKYGMFGTVCELPEHVVFVKMIGPEAEVAARKQPFVAFCASLTRTE